MPKNEALIVAIFLLKSKQEGMDKKECLEFCARTDSDTWFEPLAKFLELVEKEKKGEITSKDIKKVLDISIL